MDRFGNVSVLSPPQFQNQHQNLQQQQQQQQNSFIQQQYMSATQPQLFNNSNTTNNFTRSAFSQQPFTTMSNPISNMSTSAAATTNNNNNNNNSLINNSSLFSSNNFNNGNINAMNNPLSTTTTTTTTASGVNTSLSTRNTNSGQPQWFTNSKKRAIPQNIVKRPSFKRVINPTGKNPNPLNPLNKKNEDCSNDDGFDTISFGSKKIVSLNNENNFNNSTGLSNAVNNTLNADNLLHDSTDVPPMVSLNDWKTEEESKSTSILPINNNVSTSTTSLFTLRSSNNKNNNNNNTNKTLNNSSHISHVNNAFDKDSRLTNNNGLVSSPNFTPNQQQNNNSNHLNGEVSNDTTNRSQLKHEFAIIVFGYPESVSNLIITHFSKFGNILEDFQVLRSSTGISKFNPKTNGKKYPIFTGDGWIKLTYDSQGSAIRALQENGKVITGCILGVLPYNKEIVEQLASCKISKSENIGENGITPSISPITDDSIHTPAISSIENGVNVIANSDLNKNDSNSPMKTSNITQGSKFLSNHRLTIKDGKSLFIHNTNANNHNFLQNLEKKMREQEQLSQSKYNSTSINSTNNTSLSKNQTNTLLHSVNNWLFGWNNL